MSPLISIILPYSNREAYLCRTIFSILEVEYRPLEVILINNNSTDLSEKLAEKFMQLFVNYNICCVMLNEDQQGVCNARNKGILHASGEFIYFFDSDDEISKDIFESITQLPKDIELVIIPTHIYLNTGRRKKKYIHKRLTASTQIITSSLSTQTMLFRNSLLKKVGLWNINLRVWNDWEMGVRTLLLSSKYIILRGRYNKIYQHNTSITGESLEKKYQACLKSLHSIEKYNLTPKEKKALRGRRILLQAKMDRNHLYFGKFHPFINISNLSFKERIIYLYSKYIKKYDWILLLFE